MQVVIEPSASDGLRQLPVNIRERIQGAMRTRLATHPEMYGKPLSGTLHSYWCLRVGDYRIIYTMEKHKTTVWLIVNRRDAYTHMFAKLLSKLN